MSFDNIPQEMRNYSHFVVWKYEQRDGSDKPTKNLYSPLYGYQASTTSPGTWGSYDDARRAFDAGGWDGIGFVFTDDDPFAGIDLDDTEGDQADYDRQLRIFDEFQSYAEYSPSGKGVHIIVRGSVAQGRRRSKIEVYSSQRFFTMTGNVLRDATIADCNDKLQVLWNAMRPVNDRADDGFNGPEREPDTAMLERAFAAANGDKARDLYEGRWQAHYASQSEADFALCDILAFYSDNRAQIVRVFRASALGQRDKAGRDDYVARMLARVFDRRAPSVDTAAAIANAKAFIDAQIAADAAGLPTFDMPADDALPTFDVGSFNGLDVTPREWLVEGMIPANNVTLFYGDGGSGKSLLAAQLCVAKVLGCGWIGSEPLTKGNALYVSAEDDLPEVHRRMADIVRHHEVSMFDLRGLAVVPLADRDALLAVQGRTRGILEPTPLYAALAARIAALRPALVVVDTLADTFGGDENDRSQARQFVGLLRRLAIGFNTTVVVLAHPSRDGMKTGRGDGASTGWHNSVRSRLYLIEHPDEPLNRILTTKKANYGPKGGEITVQWFRGVFVMVAAKSNEPAHKKTAEDAADQLFLELLADFTAQGRTVSPESSSRTNAALQFANTPKGKEFDRRGFDRAMQRLFEAGRIVVETVGPPSKQKPVIRAIEGVPTPSDPPSDRFPTPSDPYSDPPADVFRPPC